MSKKVKILCKGCRKNLGLFPEGLINCALVEGPTQPIERKRGMKFEDCPMRRAPFLASPLLEGKELMEMAQRARNGEQFFDPSYER